MTTHSEIINLKGVIKVFLMSVSLWLTLISLAQAEVIKSFDSAIEVQENGSLLITETIVYDFEADSRHGIFRNISEKHAQPATTWYKNRYIDLELISVKRNEQTEPYLIQDYDGLSVRIGSADSFITGQHTYEIVYKADGALASFEDGAELYWNVTGNEWEVPMEVVTATVNTVGSAHLLEGQYCYSYEGSTGATCSNKFIGNSKAEFVQSLLPPGEELTIAQKLSLSSSPELLERLNVVLLWLVIAVLWLTGLGVGLYRWRTGLKVTQSIIPQYEPYQDFKPMFTGVLFDNRLDSNDITAGIVYLAQQGFLSIKQIKEKVLFVFETTDYEITLLKPEMEAESEFHKQLLRLLFTHPDTAPKTTKLSSIRKNQEKLRKNTTIIQELKKGVVADLVKLGFLEQKMKRVVRIILTAVIFIVGFQFLVLGFSLGGIHMFATLALSIVSVGILLGFGMERKTAKGYEASNHLKGFKDFLSTVEKDRYKFHNSPNLSPKTFMEYLPYAIAFKVEEEWAEVFADIQLSNPDWYSSDISGAQFSAVSFTRDIGSFASTLGGSTGSSGSSGGGSSGGGSGGGGGGSW